MFGREFRAITVGRDGSATANTRLMGGTAAIGGTECDGTEFLTDNGSQRLAARDRIGCRSNATTQPQITGVRDRCRLTGCCHWDTELVSWRRH